MPNDTPRTSHSAPLSSSNDALLSRMSFGDHLDELRSCLIRALFGVLVGTVVSFIFGQQILEIICYPLLVVQRINGLPPSLQVLSPTAAFLAYLKIGLLAGLIVSMPWVMYQIWRFIASGLYARERRFVSLLAPTSVGLFVAGVLFLYVIVLPIALHFFIRFNSNFDMPDLAPTVVQKMLLSGDTVAIEPVDVDTPPQLSISAVDPANPIPGQMWVNSEHRRLMIHTTEGVLSIPLQVGASTGALQSVFAIDFYVSFVLMLALAFGIAFETPVVVFFLAWSGLVPTATMRRGRRYVLLVTVVLAAILTPPDVISQLLLAGPIYLLFELGLLVARSTLRNKSDKAGG